MTRARVSLLLVAVVAAVVLAGCWGGPTTSTTGSATPQAVPDGDEAASTYAVLGNVTGDVTMNVRHGDWNTTASFRFAGDVGTRRVRERITAPANQSGNLFVSNEETFWRYDDSRNVAEKHPHDENTFKSTFGTGDADFASFLQAAYDAADADGGAEGTVTDLPDVGVGPAPTVPTEEGEEGAQSARPTANVSEYVVTYEGTERVQGRSTHVLVVEPAEPDGPVAENLTITYYVDEETFFPVKVDRRTVVQGEPWRFEMTFSNLEYDVDVPPSTYEFDPGQETDVLDFADGVVQFETREALAANVSVPIPEPTVPEDYEFESGAGIELNTSGGQVVYSNGTTVLVVGRYQDDGIITSNEREVAENVTIDGHRALYLEDERATFVYAYCEEYVVSVAAIGPMERETVEGVVASLECDGNATASTASPLEQSDVEATAWQKPIDGRTMAEGRSTRDGLWLTDRVRATDGVRGTDARMELERTS